VTPEAARRIVLEHIEVVSGTEIVPLHAAVGRIAAEDLLSAVALPSFDNAAVDGFGIHADDHNLPIPLTLSIVERVPAGPNVNVLSRSGTALRILTGAKVPAGIGSVVFERRTTRRGNKITLNELPESGANIRRRGEDVTPGTIVVSKGTTLDARQIAILAAAGITRTPVTRRLRVGILSRGGQLVDANCEPDSGGTIATNRSMLLALLAPPSIETIDLRVADTQTAISAALRDGAKHLDLLIMSAGIAGNDRDRLEAAFRAAGGICQSLKLALRPGKPLAKGRIGRMHVLALPENPVAAFVNYLLFGQPMIRRLLGATDAGRAMSYARVAQAFGIKLVVRKLSQHASLAMDWMDCHASGDLIEGDRRACYRSLWPMASRRSGRALAMFLPMVCFAFIPLRLRSRCEGLFRGAIRCKKGAVGR